MHISIVEKAASDGSILCDMVLQQEGVEIVLPAVDFDNAGKFVEGLKALIDKHTVESFDISW